MTPAEKLEIEIERVLDCEGMFATAKREAVDSEYTHKMKRAVEYLKADGTIKEKEMIADKECSAEMKARFKSEAEAEIAYQKLQDARAVLSARQSILNAETKRPI